MPKKQSQKVSASLNPTAPQKTVAKEVLEKAYRLVKRSGIPAKKRAAPAMSLDDIVAFSQTPEAMAHTIAYIQRHGGPLYTTDAKYPDLIVEVSPDGIRRLGRLVNRKFIECGTPIGHAANSTVFKGSLYRAGP
ncbi:MAG: hypothetical protein WC661_02040 [Opitutaceae bacterium]|jgi:hypothetical protein